MLQDKRAHFALASWKYISRIIIITIDHSDDDCASMTTIVIGGWKERRMVANSNSLSMATMTILMLEYEMI